MTDRGATVTYQFTLMYKDGTVSKWNRQDAHQWMYSKRDYFAHGVFLNTPPNTPSQTTSSDWEFLVEFLKILREKESLLEDLQ